LVSPNRGLLVYTPAAALALPAFRLWRTPHGWLAYLPFGIVGYLLLYSAWFGWWGGYCFGPRFLTDTLPAIILCMAGPVERLWRRPAGRAAVATLVGWGFLVQIVGVYYADKSWDVAPLPGGSRLNREWDWSDLQIVRGARSGFHGTELAPLLLQTLTDRVAAELRPMTTAELAGEIDLHNAVPLRATRGRALHLDLSVINRSLATWPAFSDYGYLQCKLAYRWWSEGRLRPESGGAALPYNLAAGKAAEMQMSVDTPNSPGVYELELVVVQVLDVDKGLSGGATLRGPVQVEAY